MDGLRGVKDYGIGFVQYHTHPLTVLHLTFLLTYTVVTFFLYDYLFRYTLFKWMYLGSIVMVIGFIYGDTQPATADATITAMKSVASTTFNLGTI